MKRYSIIFAVGIFLISLSTSCFLIKPKVVTPPSLFEQLSDIQGISVKKIATPSGYKEAYKLTITQPIDHNNPDAGTFEQRVWLSFKSFNRPNVIITEGYESSYNSITEIAKLLNANQIVVEHRYFGKSVPDSLDWSKLNLFQATNDLHKIRTLLGEIFTNPWVSSGISKGGQTTIAYRFFFPDDVSASVPYVAPLTFAREDDRILTFIAEEVGTEKCRNKVIKFQHDVFENKEIILPEFIEFAQKKNMTFDAVGGYEAAFEYGVLEFSFAFWQWGYSCSSIPNDVTNLDSTMSILKRVNGFDFFSDESARGLRPYFYQALTEMGIYTYSTDNFEGLLKYAQNPTFDFTMENKIPTKYSDSLDIAMNEWLLNEGNNFIYIYGGFDPWGACAVEVDNSKTNALKLVAPTGSHSTRIRTFGYETKTQVRDSLAKWLNFKL